jgi:hypothetical protein
VIVTGFKDNVDSAVAVLTPALEQLVVLDFSISDEEIEPLRRNQIAVQVLVSPADVYIASEANLRQTSHCFYSFTKSVYTLQLVGSTSVVQSAYSAISDFIKSNQRDLRDSNLIVLVPAKMKKRLSKIKSKLIKDAEHNYPGTCFRLKLIKPSNCRRPLSVLLSGTWPQILLAKGILANETEYCTANSFSSEYGPQVSTQLARHLLKNAAKYMSQRHKVLPRALASYMMSTWELASADLECCVYPNHKQKVLHDNLLRRMSTDPFILPFLISLSTSQQALDLTLNRLGSSPKAALEAVKEYSEDFIYHYKPAADVVYDNLTFQEFVELHWIDDALTCEANWTKTVAALINEVRQEPIQSMNFYASPLSFCVSNLTYSLERDVMERLKELNEMLNRVKIYRSNELRLIQKVDSTKVPDAVRLNADIIVSGNLNQRNLLYITSPQKTLEFDKSTPTHS